MNILDINAKNIKKLQEEFRKIFSKKSIKKTRNKSSKSRTKFNKSSKLNKTSEIKINDKKIRDLFNKYEIYKFYPNRKKLNNQEKFNMLKIYL